MSPELLVHISASSAFTNPRSSVDPACPLLAGRADEWVACCSARFLCVARRIAGDDEMALDILQESWIKVIQSLIEYHDGPPACAWVAAIVRNTAKNSVRARHLKREGPLPAADSLPAPGCGPEETLQQRELLLLVAQIISALPETYRQVLDLRYSQGLSTEQAAGILGISPTNVSSRLNRAVALLRHRVQALLSGSSQTHHKHGLATGRDRLAH